MNRIVSCLKKLETSVLLADDIMPDKMILCQLMLLSQGVNIIGLDMQNNIEVAMNVNLLTVVSFAQILVSLFSRNKLMHCTVKYMKNKSYKDLAIC